MILKSNTPPLCRYRSALRTLTQKCLPGIYNMRMSGNFGNSLMMSHPLKVQRGKRCRHVFFTRVSRPRPFRVLLQLCIFFTFKHVDAILVQVSAYMRTGRYVDTNPARLHASRGLAAARPHAEVAFFRTLPGVGDSALVVYSQK